jgi:hypothetical protein
MNRALAFCVLAAGAAWPLACAAGNLHKRDAGLGSPALAVATAATASTAAKSLAAVAEVVEYHHPVLDHYFITASPAEQAAVDAGAAGAWQRTGNKFPAGGPNAVCRFYGSLAPGPNSHFFTADAAECAELKRLQSIVPATQKRWNFESEDFMTTPAANGACAAGLLPVYRAYNNGFARGIDSNHRITANPADYLKTVAGGWTGEGIVMCAPLPQAALPLQFGACSESDCPNDVRNLGNGPYLVNVIVEIRNPGPTPVEFVIPAGQTFIASPAIFQNGLAIERLAATIAPGATARFVLFLFCIERDGDGSNTGTTYTLGPQTTDPGLLDLIALARDKLGAARDPAHIKSDAVQSAVWEITDGSGALGANSRSLLVALLAAPADDHSLQAAIYAQLKLTLTHPD